MDVAALARQRQDGHAQAEAKQKQTLVLKYEVMGLDFSLHETMLTLKMEMAEVVHALQKKDGTVAQKQFPLYVGNFLSPALQKRKQMEA